MKKNKKKEKQLIGWQEWVQLPELGIFAIKAKVDTGAKTSALHALDITTFQSDGQDFVSFTVVPLQRDRHVRLKCTAQLLGQKMVRSSTGEPEQRYAIRTPLVLANKVWDIDVTLTNREPLIFRMLLGREALASHCVIDPDKRFILGRLSGLRVKDFYQ